MRFLAVLSFSLTLFLLIPVTVLAFTATTHSVSIPYEPFMLRGSIATEQILLGELTGDPHMYEFAVGENTPVKFILTQAEAKEPIPLSLIIVEVQESNRGVVEVGRLSAEGKTWQAYTDSAFGIDLIATDTFTAELTPGLYRVEVSAAENEGKYALISGTVTNEETGYFSKVGTIRDIQRFFGASFLAVFLIPYVYIPLGFILLLIAFFLTRRYQAKLQPHA